MHPLRPKLKEINLSTLKLKVNVKLSKGNVNKLLRFTANQRILTDCLISHPTTQLRTGPLRSADSLGDENEHLRQIFHKNDYIDEFIDTNKY